MRREIDIGDNLLILLCVALGVAVLIAGTFIESKKPDAKTEPTKAEVSKP